jgi:hypothetical protein
MSISALRNEYPLPLDYDRKFSALFGRLANHDCGPRTKNKIIIAREKKRGERRKEGGSDIELTLSELLFRMYVVSRRQGSSLSADSGCSPA